MAALHAYIVHSGSKCAAGGPPNPRHVMHHCRESVMYPHIWQLASGHLASFAATRQASGHASPGSPKSVARMSVRLKSVWHCSNLKDRLAATRQAYSSSGASKLPDLSTPLDSNTNMISSLRIRASTPSTASTHPVLSKSQLSAKYGSSGSVATARPFHAPQQAPFQRDEFSSNKAHGSPGSPGAQSLEGA